VTSSRIVVAPRRITIRSRWRVRVSSDTAAQPRQQGSTRTWRPVNVIELQWALACGP
jgi:hypothetical protein